MLFPRHLTLALLYAPTFGIAMSHAATSQSVPPLSVEEAVALATAHASDAESSRGTIEAATRMTVAAGQLPDPILKFGLSNVPVNDPDQFSISRDLMTMRSVSVIQELTYGDKRHTEAARFEAEAASAEAQRAVGLTNMQRNAVGAWLDRWYTEQTGALLGHHDRSSELASQAVAAAYRSGRGTRTDMLAMKLEIQKLHDRLDKNRVAVATSTVTLKHWVGPTANRSLSEPPYLDTPPPVERLARGDLDAVSEITTAQREMGLAESEIQTAAQAKKPDVTVELMYSQRDSALSSTGSTNASFPLPWDRSNRQDHEVVTRLVQAQAARAKSEIFRHDTQAMIGAKLAELQHNLERLKRYDEKTLPLASTQAEAALTAYRANTGSLLAVAEANHRAIDTELERLALETKTAKLWADLTFLTPLPTTQTESAIRERKWKNRSL